MKATFQLLRDNPDFTKLWLAQVISLTGDWFNTVVLSALVAAYSGGSGLAVSIFLMARFLPPLLVSPFAGVLVDRFNRKNLLIASNILRAFVVPLFLLANSPDLLWLIYVVTILQFVLSAIFEPGQSAIIPSLVQPRDLVHANTLVSVTWSVMLALGAVLGGTFAHLFGKDAALLTDALTFAIAAALLVWMRYTPGKRKVNVGEEEPEDDTTFAEGLRYLRKSPAMMAALFIKIGTHIGNVDTLMTIFATQIFIIGTDGEVSLGIMYSVFGIGAFLGPILTNRLNDGSIHRMRRLVTIGFVAATVGWFVLGDATIFLLACLGIFIRAIGGSINWTYSTIIIQKTAPDAYLGRMFALDFAGFQLVTVISTIIHGALVDAIGAEKALVIAFGTGIVSTIPMLIWVVIVWQLEKHENSSTVSASMPSEG